MILKSRTIDSYGEFKLKEPITKLIISDPSYDNDVWCRYERNNLHLNTVEMGLIKDRIIDGDFEFDSYVLSMRLVDKRGNPSFEKEENYEIGVDTARYVVETNIDVAEIYTAADGGYGDVREVYFKGKPRVIDISLVIPDDVMKPQEFVESISQCLGIKSPQVIQSKVEELNLDLDALDVQETQIMG